MANPLLNLFWPGAPTDLPLPCPPGAPGSNPDASGIFDPGPLSAAYFWTNIASVAAIVIVVGFCYLMTRTTLGPGFVRRWWRSAVLAAVICALAALIVRLYPTAAFAGSCENSPEAFAWRVPWDVVLLRAAVGFGWGLAAFFLLSLLLTLTAGRVRWGGGFFHNRGYPWPRLLRPMSE